MNVLSIDTPHIFFTGKGGVGKTSTACAVAVNLADTGKRILLVSTDPASNIDEVLGQQVGTSPTSIKKLQGLSALNVDPEAAAAQYRERVIGPYRDVLPQAAVASMEEQLAGACTVEIAAFDEFAKLLGDREVTAGYDYVLFDTAPTGHTLRLLTLPAAWSGYIDKSTAGTSCIGPLQGMLEQEMLYKEAVNALSDPKRTTLVLVSRPEEAALVEAGRTSEELYDAGLTEQQLVVNGIFELNDPADELAVELHERGLQALDKMPETLRRLQVTRLLLKPGELLGIEVLRTFFSDGDLPTIKPSSSLVDLPPSFDILAQRLSDEQHGLILTMGKGGVGKTTIAIRLAKHLAATGAGVLLATTDPAAHVRRMAGEGCDNIEFSEIDPAIEVERYRAEVMATTGANLDANGLALLNEDLSSPCTEEIAVFQAFARIVEKAVDQIVVLDTAPTGHTILLLDAAQSFHREVERQSRSVPDQVIKLLPRLRDPLFTFPIICTLAEATPVHEAAALQKDLIRANIQPFAWVINQSLSARMPSDSVLVSRRNQERRYIDEVSKEHASQVYMLGWLRNPVTDVVETGAELRSAKTG